jgi:hypothetical protein
MTARRSWLAPFLYANEEQKFTLVKMWGVAEMILFSPFVKESFGTR